MLRLAVKRNSFFVLFIVFTAIFTAGCGEESSSTVPTASSSNCATYSYTSSSTVALAPSGGYAYGGVAATGATILIDDTTIAAAKVTITGGYPPFGVSSQTFASLSLSYGGPFAFNNGFGAGFLPIAASDTVPSEGDPSCTTYVFWVVPEPGNVAKGTYIDEITVTDSKGSRATITLTVTITLT